jgi:Bacterial SH3 domain
VTRSRSSSGSCAKSAEAPAYHFLPVGNESHSGQDRDNLDPSDDWIASFRDVVFPWADSEHGDEPPPRPGDDWWRTLQEKKASYAPEESPAFATEASAGRSRKRVAIGAAITAAMVVLLVAGGAVGVVALIGRDDGANSSSRAATTHRSESSTTGSAATTTTLAPASTSAPASAPPSTPGPFTVHSTCGGRDCPVAVRQTPSTGSKQAGSLRNGDVVQVNCSTHGESIQDRDTGQRSDVWYRLADTNGYASALYLLGPTVPDCGAR